MENKVIKSPQNHIIHMENRQRIDITGVINATEFNEDNIILQTQMGNLNIKGKSLKVNKLNVDTGDMCIEGEILSLTYTSKEAGNKESILKKLFK